jgi:hypothetical protein
VGTKISRKHPDIYHLDNVFLVAADDFPFGVSGNADLIGYEFDG